MLKQKKCVCNNIYIYNFALYLSSSMEEASRGTSIRAKDRPRILVKVKHQAKASGANIITEVVAAAVVVAAAAAMTSLVDMEEPNEIL